MGDQEGSIFQGRDEGDGVFYRRISRKPVKEEFTEEEFEQDLENDVTPRPFRRLRGYDSYDFKDNHAPPLPSMDKWSPEFSQITSGIQLNLHQSFDELTNGMVDIAAGGGVKKRILREGQANGHRTRPGKGHRVWIHYESYKEVKRRCETTETQVFLDSTAKHGLASTFLVGKDCILLGLNHAVESMSVKEVAEFIIECDFAYGKVGIPGFIEPDVRVRLIVQLEHVEINPSVAPEDMGVEEFAGLSIVKKLDATEKLITAGNAKFERRYFAHAVERYSRALYLLQDNFDDGCGGRRVEEPIDRKMIDLKRFQLFSNLALCSLREKKYEEVVRACESALYLHHFHPDLKPKVLYRYAVAQFHLKQFDAAMVLCDRGLRSLWGHSQFRDLKDKITTEKIIAGRKKKQ